MYSFFHMQLHSRRFFPAWLVRSIRVSSLLCTLAHMCRTNGLTMRSRAGTHTRIRPNIDIEPNDHFRQSGSPYHRKERREAKQKKKINMTPITLMKFDTKEIYRDCTTRSVFSFRLCRVQKLKTKKKTPITSKSEITASGDRQPNAKK